MAKEFIEQYTDFYTPMRERKKPKNFDLISPNVSFYF